MNSTEQEIRLGFYYCSPPARNKPSDFFETINQEIDLYSNTTNTFIFGDFNARIKTECETITGDKFDEILGVETEIESEPHPRNSEDMKIVNQRGKDFLDTCRVNNLLVANGRKIGDVFGKYTCHQKRGSSVVDYLLCTHTSLKDVIYFKVGEFSPVLSDHCPIIAMLHSKQDIKSSPPKTAKMTPLKPRYLWNEDKNKAFADTLTSQKIADKIDLLLCNPNSDPKKLAKDIKDLLIEIAESCRVKKNKKRDKPTNNNPWFDKECQTMKDDIKKNGVRQKRDPHNNGIREETYTLKKKLRKLIRQKKYKHKEAIVNNMCLNLSNGQKKLYWKHLKKLDKKTDTNTYIPDQTMVDHFKTLLHDPNTEQNQSYSTTKGQLDYMISIDELTTASKILKPGKSPGMDNILNEMLKPLVNTYPEVLLKLFNEILCTNAVTPDWLISLIVAILKKGAKEDPNNYRGIALMSCIGKLFLTILNNRLTKFALEKKLLSESQLGFVQGNRTTDPHIILHNLIQKYCHRKGKKIYSCFVDFSKAFDSIPRDILLQKLTNNGIQGKFYNIIASIYSNDVNRVKIGDKCSEPFTPNKGVRQGCVLSPLLFNLFLADLQEHLDACGDNINVSENKEISCLMWADDILIFSNSEAGLQRKLNKLAKYCRTNKLTVNTDKTQCMIFNKTGRLLKKTFFFEDTRLKIVQKYKYLGFLVTPSGEIRSGLEDLRIRALKAFMKIKNSLGSLFRSNLKNSIHLYNFMVRPILLYASDFWGALKLPKNNPIEKLHNMFCKQLLGVQKQTNTVGILLELGMHPLSLNAIKASIKNWDRIRRNNSNDLLFESIINAAEENLPWIGNIKRTLETNGMLDSFINILDKTNQKQIQKSVENTLYERMIDQFHQNSFATIREDSSKLHTYSTLKSDIGTERYLSDIQNIRHRTAMTKLRLSNHALTIETGRHKKLDRNERLCPFCTDTIEDEIHFLIRRPTYSELRSKLLPNIPNDYCHLTDKILFKNIMCNNTKVVPTAQFICQAFDLRKIKTC